MLSTLSDIDLTQIRLQVLIRICLILLTSNSFYKNFYNDVQKKCRQIFLLSNNLNIFWRSLPAVAYVVTINL